jgi:hypothetical protein
LGLILLHCPNMISCPSKGFEIEVSILRMGS